MNADQQQEKDTSPDDPGQAIESGEPTIDEAGAHAQAGHVESADGKKGTNPDDEQTPHWESGRQQAL
jgi:hypothetical protein